MTRYRLDQAQFFTLFFFAKAQKPFELLIFDFFKYEFNTFNQHHCSIDSCFMYFFCRHDRFQSIRIISDRYCNPIYDIMSPSSSIHYNLSLDGSTSFEALLIPNFQITPVFFFLFFFSFVF